jgi:hypothetical protein
MNMAVRREHKKAFRRKLFALVDQYIAQPDSAIFVQINEALCSFSQSIRLDILMISLKLFSMLWL